MSEVKNLHDRSLYALGIFLSKKFELDAELVRAAVGEYMGVETTTVRKPKEPVALPEEGEIVMLVGYSDKSIALFGGTRAVKGELYEAKCKFNGRLSFGPGWVASIDKKDEIEALLKKLNAEKKLASGYRVLTRKEFEKETKAKSGRHPSITSDEVDGEDDPEDESAIPLTRLIAPVSSSTLPAQAVRRVVPKGGRRKID